MRENPALAPIAFSRPAIDEATIAEVGDVLRSGWITSGKHVQGFEAEFSAFCQAPFSVALSSGTAGLDLAVGALDLRPGDEVIVPSMNWVSGPNMIEIHGGKAVFCDVDPETLLINADHAAALITSRTRALMPVHFAGAPCDLTKLRSIAQQRQLALIEDAAHAVGCQFRGEPIGSQPGTPGSCAVFSFHPTKNITTAEGGMVTTHDPELYDRLKLGRFHGIRKDAWKNHARSGKDQYQVEIPGRKYNLTDIQAVIGRHQLRAVLDFNRTRTALAHHYRATLPPDGVVRPLAVPTASGDVHAWHIFVVLVEPGYQRADIIDFLAAHGIGTALHFPPVHRQAFYAPRNPQGSLPISEDVGERLLSLPLHVGMTTADVDRVVAVLRDFSRGKSP